MGMGSGKGKAPVKSVGKEKTAVKAKDKAVGKAAASKPAGGKPNVKVMETKPAAQQATDKTARLKALLDKKQAAAKPAGQKSKGLSDLMSGTKAPGMKKGGSCKKYARGGGIEVRGKTKGKLI
jgi:hypothetical protein